MKYGQLIEYNQSKFFSSKIIQEVKQGDSCRTFIRAFQNGLGKLRDICSFEDIGPSIFHAKLFKCK